MFADSGATASVFGWSVVPPSPAASKARHCRVTCVRYDALGRRFCVNVAGAADCHLAVYDAAVGVFTMVLKKNSCIFFLR